MGLQCPIVPFFGSYARCRIRSDRSGSSARLARTMQERKKQEYLADLKSPNRSYNAKFERFRKQLDSKKAFHAGGADQKA